MLWKWRTMGGLYPVVFVQFRVSLSGFRAVESNVVVVWYEYVMKSEALTHSDGEARSNLASACDH
jgi:hypothetical protein